MTEFYRVALGMSSELLTFRGKNFNAIVVLPNFNPVFRMRCDSLFERQARIADNFVVFSAFTKRNIDRHDFFLSRKRIVKELMGEDDKLGLLPGLFGYQFRT